MKNNVMWIVVGVVVLVVLVWVFKKNGDVTPNGQSSSNTEDTALEATEDLSIGSVNVTAPKPLTYTEALAKYQARRIQFNEQCRAIPNNVTYKDNTGIMLDNRSSATRTISVGAKYTVKPWGFKIVILPDIYLKAKTILVDCDGQQNVATILVQE